LKRSFSELAQSCLNALVRGRGHVWDYAGNRHFAYPGGYSRAQYSVLGLRSAVLLGLKVPDTVWEDLLNEIPKDFIVIKLLVLYIFASRSFFSYLACR